MQYIVAVGLYVAYRYVFNIIQHYIEKFQKTIHACSDELERVKRLNYDQIAQIRMLQLEVAKLLEVHKTFATDNTTRMDSLQIKLDQLHERHETLLKEHVAIAADRYRQGKKNLHITLALNCHYRDSFSLQIINASVAVELVPLRVLKNLLRVSNITAQQNIDVDDLQAKFEKMSISDGHTQLDWSLRDSHKHGSPRS